MAVFGFVLTDGFVFFLFALVDKLNDKIGDLIRQIDPADERNGRTDVAARADDYSSLSFDVPV